MKQTTAERNHIICMDIEDRRASGETTAEAYEAVAEQRGMSVEAVRTVYEQRDKRAVEISLAI